MIILQWRTLSGARRFLTELYSHIAVFSAHPNLTVYVTDILNN